MVLQFWRVNVAPGESRARSAKSAGGFGLAGWGTGIDAQSIDQIHERKPVSADDETKRPVARERASVE
jgi:hypothetical protein